MDREDSWRAIAEQRLALAHLLEQLAAEEWDRPSLCAGWRVRDVVAHLVLAAHPPPVTVVIREFLRARGRFHRLNHDVAVAHADSRSTAQLVTALREHAASRRQPPGTSYRNTVFDVVVHGQDVALPLGRELPVPVDAAVAGATRVWTMGWPFWARRRLSGLRLVATDANWTAGQGDDVEGPAVALLMLLTGRHEAALPRLRGPGLPRLAGPQPRRQP